jgi:hypothetical protein
MRESYLNGLGHVEGLLLIGARIVRVSGGVLEDELEHDGNLSLSLKITGA